MFIRQGYIINWKKIEKQSLDQTINVLAMASPFSLEEKQILLETKMVCRDGNVGPSYWELFAEFYYSVVSEQEYCRYVKGKLLPKKVCLNPDGTWRYND